MDTAIIQIKQQLFEGTTIQVDHIEHALEHLKRSFKVVEAAGGLVLNKKKEALMIFRRGFWDLPKGKLEQNEKIWEAAIREVEEETGLSKLKLDKFLHISWHIYRTKNNWCIKPSYWFLMKTEYDKTLIPQLEEDITKVKWIPLDKVNDKLKKAYPSIVEVFKQLNQ